MLRNGLILTAVVAAAFSAYARLAPSDVARWHVPVSDAPDPGTGGAKVLTDPLEGQPLARLAAVAESEGAELLAGTVEEGRMTWIARSRIMGFPDYITAEITDDNRLHVLSRLRFGAADLGVNAARMERWLAAL